MNNKNQKRLIESCKQALAHAKGEIQLKTCYVVKSDIKKDLKGQADYLEVLGGDSDLIERVRYSLNQPISESHYDLSDECHAELEELI